MTPTPVSPPVSTPTPHKDSEDYPISAIAESKPLFTPPSTDPKINQAAWNLICDAEVGTTSEAYYMTHKIRFPEWPEGQSGVTWGIGYDAGYNTKDSILRTWKQISEVERLALCAGVKGARAKTMWTTVDDILIPWSVAVEVFNETTIPRFYQEMCRAFPGAKELKLDAQGALTSMVYNRGGSLIGDSRIDLRTIAKAVPNKDYKTIAEALRHMNVTMGPKWRSQGEYAGLSKRREAEARMVEGCIK
ncbi:MAG: hypothetical protein WCL08_00030 [Verrucomicrobiota bacterium]